MFSSSIFKNKDEFKEFIETKNRTKEIIKQKIEPFINKKIVVLTGMMGAGKTSISCCLSKKSLVIEKKGIRTYLTGEGVGVGMNACTKIPSINYISEYDLVIVDLPGFEDNRKYKQEILNSIAIDYIFEILPNCIKEYKIILVFASYDFKSMKGSIVINSFARLMKMFPNYDRIKHTFGIIITKGEDNSKPINFIDDFEVMYNSTSNPNTQMQEVYHFLKSFQKNIFVFPEPLKENVGKQYNFRDISNLLNFMKKDYCQNPQHRIALSIEAESELNLSYYSFKDFVKKEVKQICQKIQNQYQKEEKSANISNWCDYINKIMGTPIKTINDFKAAIMKILPGSFMYESDFKSLNELVLFNELIIQIIPSSNDEKYLSKKIIKWCYNASNELSKKLNIAIQNEVTNRRLEEKKRMEEEYERRRKEQEEIERKNQIELDRLQKIEEENKRKMLEIQREIRRYSGG